MKRLTAYTKPVITNGTTRLKRVFAWMPMYINGFRVWLERYEILQAYVETDYLLRIDGKDAKFTVGRWTDISTRVIAVQVTEFKTKPKQEPAKA